MSALLLLGVALAFIGGIQLFLSEVLGSIVWMHIPFQEISRHVEPERFYFWRSVMIKVFVAGLLLLLVGVLF